MSKVTKKIIKKISVFILVMLWFLTGWPGFWLTPTFRFPPKIQEAKATAVSFIGTSNLIATNGGAPGAITPNASTATGDLLIFYHYGRATGGNETVTMSGFTNVFDSVTANQGHVAVKYRIRQAGDSTYTATVANYTSGTTGETILEWIETYRGFNSTSPVVNFTASLSTWATSLNIGSIAAPATATVHDGEAVVVFGGRFENVTGQTTLAGDSLTWNPGTLNNTNLGSDAGAVTQYGLNSSGADKTVTAKTITTTGTTQAGAGRMFIIQKSPTTTIGSGTDPATTSVAPETGIRDAGAFTVQTDIDADTVTALTVTLAGAGTPYSGLSEVRVTNDAGTTTYWGAVSSPASNTLTFCSAACDGNGATNIPVTSSSTQFKVRVTPKTHAGMPVPNGASYDLSPYASSLTTTNAQSGTDSNANTLTIDNLSPNGATAVSGSAGNTAVTLNWTSSSSTDFDTTNGSVILRWASGTAGAEVPAEGNSSYVAGNTITTATVACVISSATSTALNKIDGTGGSVGCTTAALTNGQAYTYKVFQRDTNGNYDTGASIGSFTPSVASASFTQNKYLWYYDNDLANPATAWGTPALPENTAIAIIPAGKDPPSTSQEIRLRVNLVVNTAALSALSNYFKLEYKLGTDGSCTTGSWTDVGTGGWTYATSTVTDGSNITASLSDTTTGKGEQYAKSKPTALNNAGANVAEIIEYDFHIVGGSATPNSTYSFRVVGTNSTATTETVLDAYTNCPTLTTEPGMADVLRHGNVFTNQSEQGFYWVD